MSDDNAFAPGSDFDRGSNDYDSEPAEPEIRSILDRSWLIARSNGAVLLSAFVVLFVIQLAAGGVGAALGVWGAIDPDMYWTSTGISVGVGFVLGFFITFLQLGFYRIVLHIDRAEAADVGMLVGETDKYAQAAIAFVIIYFSVQIGSLLCIIPGWIVAFLTSFTYIAMVDEDLDAFEALQRSVDITTKNAGLWFGMVLVYIAVTLGMLCLTLGLTLPVLMIAAPVVQVVTWRAMKAAEQY